MANDSSTGGYLSPAAGPAPLEDSALDELFQEVVMGVTGLPGSMVRPRWQPTVPKQPEAATNWCAIGITYIDPDDYPVVVHDGDGGGYDRYVIHETLIVLSSFYGPDSMFFAKLMRDGLYLAQNREFLTQHGMNLTEVGKPIAAPDLVNLQWIRRYDVEIRFRRKVERIYPILNLLSAPTEIDTDTHT